MYPFVKLFELTLPTFNLLIGISLIVGFLIYEKQAKAFENKKPFDCFQKEYFFIITIIIAFLGAAVTENYYHRDFNKIGSYGITFYGGLLSGLLINFILLKNSYKNLVLLINIALPALLIAHAFGRVGCLFAGCCYGKLTTGIIYVTYPNGEKRVPTPLIESVFLFLIYWIMLKKITFENRYLFYFISYPSLRIVIEFFRDDNRGFIYGKLISPSQYLSIFLLLSVLLIIILKKKIIVSVRKTE